MIYFIQFLSYISFSYLFEYIFLLPKSKMHVLFFKSDFKFNSKIFSFLGYYYIRLVKRFPIIRFGPFFVL